MHQHELSSLLVVSNTCAIVAALEPGTPRTARGYFLSLHTSSARCSYWSVLSAIRRSNAVVDRELLNYEHLAGRLASEYVLVGQAGIQRGQTPRLR